MTSVVVQVRRNEWKKYPDGTESMPLCELCLGKALDEWEADPNCLITQNVCEKHLAQLLDASFWETPEDEAEE